jgi:acyl-CoA synthetase (AMP-forming)/AMP-acid ligase II
MAGASEPATIGELLARASERAPAKAALIAGGRAIAFGTLDGEANRFAHAISALGLEAGERVAILCGNRPETVIAQFGIARAELVAAHLSTRYTAEEMLHTLELCAARAAVVEAPYLPSVLAFRSKLPRLATVIAVGGGDGTVPFADFVAGRATTAPTVEVRPEAPATVTFTGGTTGLPKGAVHSHAARVHWGKIAIHDFKLDADEVAMAAAPLYHAAGGFIWFLPTVMAGGTSVLMPHWNVREFVAAVARHGGTGAFMVPAQISMLLDDPAFDAEALKSLRKIIYGAAPSPPGLIARAERMLPGCEMIQNFGLTETGPLITIGPDDRRRKPEALGRPSPFVEAAIFASPGRRARPGEVGEIAARGVHVMSGYLGDGAASAEFFRGSDGWGFTGDLAVADDDGLVTLVDRIKDIIISGGVNIYPAEIERALIDHPAVADCAAFGVPDARWGELPAVAAVLKRGATATVEELSAYCAGRIARHKRPRRVVVVPSLPRTAAGKIQRKALKELFG